MGVAELVIGLYLAVVGLLGCNGLHRLWMLRTYRRGRPAAEPVASEDLPVVTVQLPVFNERAVVERLVAAVGELDYPSDRLQIQVLDDSTDDTTERAAAAVKRLVDQGLDASLRHRTDRTGFKAGALQEGLADARGELIAIFDADFVPPRDFLRQTVPWFGPGIGMVQARWGHLNAQDSWLTQVQAILLDGHFVLEHSARHWAGCWFNFNGTAGMWRRQAIADAGGWQHDTLTEDLDLSYRAQLAGWDFVYLDDLVAPAELPPTMAAFKTQQHRWAKGSVQTARKLLARIWRSGAPLRVKIEATAHLTANFAYPLVVVLSILLPPSILARAEQPLSVALLSVDLFVLGVGVLPFAVFYAVAIRDGGHGQPYRRLPIVLAVGIGMALAQSRAVFEGLFGRVGSFVRTPKQGDAADLAYKAAVHGLVYIEALVATYLVVATVLLAALGHIISMPFLLLFTVGWSVVAFQSLRERHSPPARRVPVPT